MSFKASFLAAFLSLGFIGVLGQQFTKIVGGLNAEVGQFPHQVALFKDGNFNCGGSLISSRYVLTAAHCVVVGDSTETLPTRYYTVRLGSIQRIAGGKLLGVKRIKVRKSYGNFLDDVALLELREEIQFSKNINKIELYDGEVSEGEKIIVSGWGRLTHGGETPHRLQYTTLTALHNDTCNDLIGWGNEQIICLAHDKDNGVCNGDSGGPATYQGKLVGVAGFVVSGCGSVNPDGYAKVSYHRSWILENMT